MNNNIEPSKFNWIEVEYRNEQIPPDLLFFAKKDKETGDLIVKGSLSLIINSNLNEKDIIS